MSEDSKVTYRSKDVVIVQGVDAATAIAREKGLDWTEKEMKSVMEFAQEIIHQGKIRGMSPQMCFIAVLNAMVAMIDSVKTMEDRSGLVSVVTEALCAAVGGGLDTAKRT